MSKSREVWKFAVSGTDAFSVAMPVGARLLAVDEQRGEPFMWALVDPEAKVEPRDFRMVGTGHPVDPGELGEYVGTFQLAGGGLVFHLFEKGAPTDGE